MYTLRLALVAFVLASLALAQGTTALAASGYMLFGDAEIVSGGNPGNAAQLRSDESPGFGGVDFDTPAGMTVSDLTNLSTDYKFTAASCGGGAPRFQINVTTPASLTKNIHVYIGPPPNYTLCPPNVWANTLNLVTPASLVDTGQLPGGTFYDPWAHVLIAYGSYPVTGIQLVTDSTWFFAGATQTVVVDNVVINSTTYTFEPEPTKDSCKKGGWQDFTSSPGPFKNQGDCVSFFASGGKNEADE
ncbi:MAG: hypothetical protein ACRDG6_13625 [Candidatus Limnocylindria bacterium]